ncbi:LOW QUALITY PROTEIN: TBC1 domain family member 21 [Morphnus guianensis]
MVDKKQLEKILLLSSFCILHMKYHQGFCEMLLLFHLLVKREHEVYWLFQFFLQKTHSCVMNIGVGKSFIMLKTSVTFRDPTFAKHLGEFKASSAPPQIQQKTPPQIQQQHLERMPAKESKYLYSDWRHLNLLNMLSTWRVCFSHLSEGKGPQVIHSLVPCFCFSFQQVFKSFDNVWRLWEVNVCRSHPWSPLPVLHLPRYPEHRASLHPALSICNSWSTGRREVSLLAAHP